jgi:hypothetical protein
MFSLSANFTHRLKMNYSLRVKSGNTPLNNSNPFSFLRLSLDTDPMTVQINFPAMKTIWVIITAQRMRLFRASQATQNRNYYDLPLMG